MLQESRIKPQVVTLCGCVLRGKVEKEHNEERGVRLQTAGSSKHVFGLPFIASMYTSDEII